MVLAQAERPLANAEKLAAVIADPRDPLRLVHRLPQICGLAFWRSPAATRMPTISIGFAPRQDAVRSGGHCPFAPARALQNDFTAYKVGNILYNLANRIPTAKDSSGNVISDRPGAPVPIPASMIDLDEFNTLNKANLDFVSDLKAAEARKDSSKAFFVSSDKTFVDYDPSMTSFLCTDTARAIFERGGNKLDDPLKFANSRFPDENDVLTNEQCLAEAA